MLITNSLTSLPQKVISPAGGSLAENSANDADKHFGISESAQYIDNYKSTLELRELQEKVSKLQAEKKDLEIVKEFITLPRRKRPTPAPVQYDRILATCKNSYEYRTFMKESATIFLGRVSLFVELPLIIGYTAWCFSTGMFNQLSLGLAGALAAHVIVPAQIYNRFVYPGKVEKFVKHTIDQDDKRVRDDLTYYEDRLKSAEAGIKLKIPGKEDQKGGIDDEPDFICIDGIRIKKHPDAHGLHIELHNWGNYPGEAEIWPAYKDLAFAKDTKWEAALNRLAGGQ